MSLMRQLWLAAILSSIVAFIGSLTISVWSAQSYLTQQLEQKNTDVANSLALSLTQVERGKNLIDLQVAALFDTGFYQSISVIDSLGRVISMREKESVETDVPAWFVRFLHIESKPGVAEIGTGWQHYGSVRVVSHNQFALQILWNQAVKLFFWFGLICIVVGILFMLVLRSIGRSLDMVVEQARAIGERRLRTIAEPRIKELKALARAMNGMVERVWKLFNEEASRIDDLRRSVNHDQLTGLPNRDYFMAHLKAHLLATESAQCGVIVMIRLDDLNHINSVLGRHETDNLLKSLAEVVQDFAVNFEDALSGRIKGGEMALMIPGECDAHQIAKQLADNLAQHFLGKWHQLQDLYHMGAVRFERTTSLVDILSQVDHALAVADDQGPNSSHAIDMQESAVVMPAEQWHNLILHAVNHNNLRLALYPVQDKQGQVLHQEGMVRLRNEQTNVLIMAGEFMPFVTHFSLNAMVDLEVARMAIKYLSTTNDQLAINITAASISNWTFRTELAKLLRSAHEVCPRLWLEVTEYGAFKHFDAFRDVCFALKGLRCHVGVEQFGQRMSEIQKITELGLDYVKLHPNLVEGITDNAGNQEFIRRFCEVVHTVGVKVIAVGVQTDDEWRIMRNLGADAVTGPMVGGQVVVH